MDCATVLNSAHNSPRMARALYYTAMLFGSEASNQGGIRDRAERIVRQDGGGGFVVCVYSTCIYDDYRVGPLVIVLYLFLHRLLGA